MDAHKEDICTIVINDIAPVSVNAMYRSVGRRVVMSAKGRCFKNELTTRLLNCDTVKKIHGPVEVWVDFEFTDRRKRDVDNFAKAVLDCLKGLVFDDDSDIWILHLSKKLKCDRHKIKIVCKNASEPDI